MEKEKEESKKERWQQSGKSVKELCDSTQGKRVMPDIKTLKKNNTLIIEWKQNKRK